MVVKAIKTKKVLLGKDNLLDLLNDNLPELREASVVAITSKIVSLCENRVIPIAGTDKEKLIIEEADYYMPSHISRYGYYFTIRNNSLVSSSGIDTSNGSDSYILWPFDPQQTANDVRAYLKKHFNLKHVGVLITDSTSFPLRLGQIGIVIGFSGFKPVKNYVGTSDLFGRPFKVSRAGIATGLACSAVLVMGEGAEQTPIAVIEDVPFVEFQDYDPTPQDLADLYISPEEDLYAPFLSSLEWQKGGRNSDEE